jgi:hypothetical protein
LSHLNLFLQYSRKFIKYKTIYYLQICLIPILPIYDDNV